MPEKLKFNPNKFQAVPEDFEFSDTSEEETSSE